MNEKAEEVAPSQSVKENPLNNSVILANIFKFVDNAEDIKMIRLTNSLWLKVSWKQWECLVMYHISPDKPYRTCKCQPRINESQYHKRIYSLREFFAKWESVGPHNRQLMLHFRLTGFCLVHPPTDKVYIDLIRLFDLVESNLTYLHLDHCTFYRSKYLNSFKWILSKCFNLQSLIVVLDKTCVLQPQDSEEFEALSHENLKQLSFIRCKVNIRHYDDCNQIISDTLFRHLVQMTPNVKTFELNIGRLTDESINALTRPQPNTMPWRLTNLTLTDHWLFLRRMLGTHVENLIIFIRSTLPTLEVVKLIVGVENRDANTFTHHFPRLLATCQNSLKELNVTRAKLEKREVPRSISECLKSLQLPLLTHLYVTRESSISFASLGRAPNLRLLHLKSALKHNWNQLIAAEGDNLEGEALLEKLEDFYSDYSWFVSKSLRILKKWMPNVKEMGIVVTPKTLPIVLELWPDLDKLVLIRGSVLVEGGMPISSDVVHLEKGQFN